MRQFETKGHPVWKCQKCGWLMSDECYLAMRFDVPCPRCGLARLSSFEFRVNLFGPSD